MQISVSRVLKSRVVFVEGYDWSKITLFRVIYKKGLDKMRNGPIVIEIDMFVNQSNQISCCVCFLLKFYR